MGGSHSEDRAVFAENDRPLNGIDLMRENFPDFDIETIDGRMRMIRTRQYTLIWKDDESTEAYDLIADPEELDDLSEQDPELSRMHVTDPETRAQLRSLGYVE